MKYVLSFSLFLGGIVFSTALLSASCCGGGSASSLVLSKFSTLMFDTSLDIEFYDGFWNNEGKSTPDPEGADLKQYRLNAGLAYRFSSNWQGSVVLPHVWNDSQYSGFSTQTRGLGDMKVNLLYEAFDGATCVWKVRKWQDFKPAMYFGLGITLPTGVSPYDSVDNSFDITGLGLYRLDGTIMLEKTIFPFNASLLLNYGKYLERSVNREYGKFIEPYQKNLGDRFLASFSFGGTSTLESMDTLTSTVTISHLQEGKATIDGVKDDSSGFVKHSLGLAIAYATMDRDWVVKASFNHTIPTDDWGRNFPITNVVTLGVSHVLR